MYAYIYMYIYTYVYIYFFYIYIYTYIYIYIIIYLSSCLFSVFSCTITLYAKVSWKSNVRINIKRRGATVLRAVRAP